MNNFQSLNPETSNLLSLLIKLKELNIKIQVIDGQLKVNAPKGKLNPTLIDELKKRKEEIISFLQRSEKQQSNYIEIKNTEKKEYYPLSSAQKRLYILQQMVPKSTAYNIPQFIELNGEQEKETLEVTFLKLIERHESLRSSFHMLLGSPWQRIHPPGKIVFKIDTHLPSDGNPDEIIKNFVRPFNLEKSPLIRAGLIKVDKLKYILMLDIHHIISDGISQGILIEDFTNLDIGNNLPLLKLQYKDYAKWQQSEKIQKSLEKQEQYWLKEFQGKLPTLNLPFDFPRPAFQSFKGNIIEFQLTPEQSGTLFELSQTKGVTLFMLLVTILNIFLSKLSGIEEIIIGTPIAGRSHADLERIIGMFVNTLPLKNNCRRKKSFNSFLNEVKTKSLQAFDNQDYQFEDLVEKLNIPRDLSRNPIFDVMFELDNTPVFEKFSPGEKQGVKIFQTSHHRTAKFDLTISAFIERKTLTFMFEYCTLLFKKDSIKRFINYLKTIISFIIGNQNFLLSEIEIIPETEKQLILFEFNNTTISYPRDKTINQLFSQQAQKFPDNIAIVGPQLNNFPIEFKNNIHLSYQALNSTAHQLSAILKRDIITAETIVGIMVERSIEMVIGLLGILKSNSTYLPIDPHYPEQRKSYMIRDCHIDILLTASTTSNFYGVGKIIHLDNLFIKNELKLSYDEDQKQRNSLVYIMYTSGSTGIPKGVMINNQNIVRLVKNNNFVDLREKQRILQTGALEFDASTFEIWGALLNGLTLFLSHKEYILNATQLKNILIKNFITTIWMTSPLFNQMVMEDLEIFSGLSNLLVGGDILSPLHINQVRNQYPYLKIINGYGPTENTTFSTTFLIDEKYETNIPIGKPISNSTAIIINNDNQIQPIGISGELWVGGDGVSRGYLNDPELTSDKFTPFYDSQLISSQEELYGKEKISTKIPSNIKSLKKQVFYKTGDLARWLPDGNIEFLGRIDFQVKIRGFRIELKEIERQLLNISEIKEAVVIARQNETEKYLCAYLVSQKENPISEIRKHLSQRIPDYMIPSHIVYLQQLPLTPNGKVDSRALPEPEIKIEKDHVSPQNFLEQKLTEIWAEELNIEIKKISINANFFQLGGHSLKATRIASTIHKTLNIQIPLAKIFEKPTIRELADYIENERECNLSEHKQIESVEKKEYYDLSYAQKRLWILDQMEEELIAYNMPGSNEFKELNIDAFSKAFKTIVERHESLRTIFISVKEEPKQRIIDPEIMDIKIHYQDLRNKKNKEILIEKIKEEEIKKPFNLNTGPLIRTKLLHIEENRIIFLYTIHHIISDAWSMEVLINEFLTLYFSYRYDKDHPLPPLRIQYKDYTQWHNNQLSGENLKRHKDYWLNVYKGNIPVLKFPLDFPRPKLKSYQGATLIFSLNSEITKHLKRISHKFNCTMFITFLAVMNTFLYRYTGQQDIIVGTPAAGREHKDLENQMGFYVNMLALRNKLKAGLSFREILEAIRNNTMGAFEHQIYPFDLLVNDLNLPRDLSRNPLFDIVITAQTVQAPPKDSPISMLPKDFASGDQINNGFGTSKNDLRLRFLDFETESQIHIQYNPELFKKERIAIIKKRLITLITDITNNIEKKIDNLNFETEITKTQPKKKFQGGF